MLLDLFTVALVCFTYEHRKKFSRFSPNVAGILFIFFFDRNRPAADAVRAEGPPQSGAPQCPAQGE